MENRFGYCWARKAMRILLLMHVLVTVLLHTGCGTTHHIMLIDTETFRTVVIKGGDEYGQQLVSARANVEFLYYVFRNEATWHELTFVKSDLEGRTISETPMPLFSRWYELSPIVLRPDGDAVAYMRDDTSKLHMYDFAEKKETLVVDRSISARVCIVDMVWINNDEMIVVLFGSRDVGGWGGNIVKINVKSKQIVGRVTLDQPGDPSLSPDGRLLAITTQVGKAMQILDVRTLSVVADVLSPGQGRIEGTSWNISGTKLAYVDRNNWVSVFTLADGSILRVSKIRKGRGCYWISFAGDHMLVYLSGPEPYPGVTRTDMHFVDVPSKRVKKRISMFGLAGNAIVSNGKAVACVW